MPLESLAEEGQWEGPEETTSTNHLQPISEDEPSQPPQQNAPAQQPVPAEEPAAVVEPPRHPVPQMQGAFEESLWETVNDGDGDAIAMAQSRWIKADAVTRRKYLLENDKYERTVAGRWVQRPNEKFHPLWKLVSQISFGMHLLQTGMAKSDDEVIKILQTHVDDIDGFLERTTEDFDLAQTDINERIRYLQLPLEHGQVFDQMLTDRAFRSAIVDGNEKIEHIVQRTNTAMKDSMKDVQKGLDGTRELSRFLQELQRKWPNKSEDHAAVFQAMLGNTDGWAIAYKELQQKGSQLGLSLVQLEGVISEIQRRAGVASRRNLPSPKRPDQSHRSQYSTPGRSPSTTAPQSPRFPGSPRDMLSPPVEGHGPRESSQSRKKLPHDPTTTMAFSRAAKGSQPVELPADDNSWRKSMTAQVITSASSDAGSIMSRSRHSRAESTTENPSRQSVIKVNTSDPANEIAATTATPEAPQIKSPIITPPQPEALSGHTQADTGQKELTNGIAETPTQNESETAQSSLAIPQQQFKAGHRRGQDSTSSAGLSSIGGSSIEDAEFFEGTEVREVSTANKALRPMIKTLNMKDSSDTLLASSTVRDGLLSPVHSNMNSTTTEANDIKEIMNDTPVSIGPPIAAETPPTPVPGPVSTLQAASSAPSEATKPSPNQEQNMQRPVLTTIQSPDTTPKAPQGSWQASAPAQASRQSSESSTEVPPLSATVTGPPQDPYAPRSNALLERAQRLRDELVRFADALDEEKNASNVPNCSVSLSPASSRSQVNNLTSTSTSTSTVTTTTRTIGPKTFTTIVTRDSSQPLTSSTGFLSPAANTLSPTSSTSTQATGTSADDPDQKANRNLLSAEPSTPRRTLSPFPSVSSYDIHANASSEARNKDLAAQMEATARQNQSTNGITSRKGSLGGGSGIGLKKMFSRPSLGSGRSRSGTKGSSKNVPAFGGLSRSQTEKST